MDKFRLDWYWESMEQNQEVAENSKYLGRMFANILLSAMVTEFAVSRSNDPVLLRRSSLVNVGVWALLILESIYMLSFNYGGLGNYGSILMSTVWCCVFGYGYTKLSDAKDPQYYGAIDEDGEGLKFAKRAVAVVAIVMTPFVLLFLFAKDFTMTYYFPGLSQLTEEGSRIANFNCLWCGLCMAWTLANYACFSKSNDASAIKTLAGLNTISWAYCTCFLLWLCYTGAAGKFMWSGVIMDFILTPVWCYTYFKTNGAAGNTTVSKPGGANGGREIMSHA
eukprot:CAMPEP_0204344874 /NCGR_PEP_ID=MMETSP0469-20131031/25954_1 /ASSEMBLY_ACC=CAM_ASM_000384 /TAXON_ID=2969 /ORGANISM="Oxyrrhis marina" /LENGTH=278 /DNA_ID=CAMNT_0051330215 /DNA_START=61 /DNA_END=897 /DNA_ORIENTATION=-